MPASYQTGPATSPVNLLQTLVTWLVAQGWTTDLSAADGTSSQGWRAHLHKGGLYVNFRAATDEKIFHYRPAGAPGSIVDYDWDPGFGIGFYLGTGFSGAATWWEQAGRPTVPDAGADGGVTGTGAGMNLPSGSISGYHFFDDGADNVVVVVEKTPGIYVHLGWCPALVGAGNPEAFPHFFGSSPAAYVTDNSGVTGPGLTATAHAPGTHSFVHSLYVDGTAFWRVDAATWSSRWVSNSGAPSNPVPGREYGWAGRPGRAAVNQSSQTFGLEEGEYVGWRILKDRAWQTAQVAALPLPVHLHVKLEPQARWAHVGRHPSTFYSSAVGHGFSPGQIAPIGGQNYMLFPNFAVKKDA